MRKSFLAVLAAALLLGVAARAEQPKDWTTPFPPFRIAGNLYYVGSADLASYLVVTPKGDILINSNLESSPALIRKSVEKLGFKFSDVKILLISHAHFDHAAGSALIKKMTGAKYEVMDADVATVESGGRDDFAFGHDRTMWFPPTKVDRVLHDGDTVELGGTVLTAHKTAGHTKGAITWTMDEQQGGKVLHVVIVGGPYALSSYKLVGNKQYPQIAQDFERQFAELRALPCDVFLGAHGIYFGLKEKYARFQAGDRNAFIDPAGYRKFVEDAQRNFEAQLKKQRAAAR
ncbi:MAG: subclass B3 metallo-beta-lactamase [Acidobacteriota bacterium]